MFEGTRISTRLLDLFGRFEWLARVSRAIRFEEFPRCRVEQWDE